MAGTVFCVDNRFNEFTYSSYVIDAESEATGFEYWKAFNGRRHASDFWKPTADNNDTWQRLDAGAAVSLDYLAFDRDHNLAGKTVKVQKSTDNFAANVVDVATLVIPSSASADTDIDAANGAYTEEGALIKRFTADSSRYWRIFYPAVASWRPNIVGAWLGTSWQPGAPIQKPFEDENIELGMQESVSPLLWSGGTEPANRRGGAVTIHLNPGSDESAARTYILQQYMRGRTMWITFDQAKAERTVLTKAPPHRVRYPIDLDWAYRSLEFQWAEWQPKPL